MHENGRYVELKQKALVELIGRAPPWGRRILATDLLHRCEVGLDTHVPVGMRTHVILREDQRSYLLNESARTGLTMSELVRRAVDPTYPTAARRHVGGFELDVGLWRRLDAAVSGRRLREIR